MKISASSLSMLSVHDRTEQHSVLETLHIQSTRPAEPAAPSLQPTVTLSSQGQRTAATDAAQNGTELDPKLQLLIALLEKLTGYKFHITSSQIAVPDTTAPAPTQQSVAAPQAGYSGEYSRTESYSLSEQTTFQASGVIKTSDGREIRFDFGLSMQYQYSETSSTQIRFGDAARKTDPLVLNFNGTAAQLSDQRFAFDLDSDGTSEEISVPVSGTGFLALDKNGNGSIDDGSELFGPGSGDGFSDLAQYDDDGNGWIDENDTVFSQLRVWQPDASGNGTLQSLSSLGIGAISLQAIATPFDIRNAFNQVLGSVRASGVVLNENGTIGSIQQVDLTA